MGLKRCFYELPVCDYLNCQKTSLSMVTKLCGKYVFSKGMSRKGRRLMLVYLNLPELHLKVMISFLYFFSCSTFFIKKGQYVGINAMYCFFAYSVCVCVRVRVRVCPIFASLSMDSVQSTV